ncbi:MAG: chromosomal replication initiator protein DnaA [Magnetococcales bacterium]|nr:chromosomal replication initiator protein DnaA [Magnetococcales bacterium]HIJ84115.1 chromosomal replication initiator protein DnaA [Magnetococcales bacterium]
MEEFWTKAVASVGAQVSPEVFNLWIKPLRPGKKLSDGRLEILCHNDFAADYVRSHYGTLLESAIAVERGTHQSLSFRANPEASNFSEKPSPKESSPRQDAATQTQTNEVPPVQPAANSGLMERYTFESFVVGACNQFAHAAAARVADGPPLVYNPLYMHGGTGLGKTHLLHAIGHKVLKDRPQTKVRYISSEKFMTLFIDYTRMGRVNDFKGQFRSVDMLLVDDIHFFAGKKGTQEEFFHTFNALYGDAKQIILTSDSLPSDMPLDERLRSRFAQGLVVDLHPPDLETRVAILKKKAAIEGIDLQDDVAFFLADAIHTNVRELEGALIRVFALASMEKAPITMALVKESLRNILKNPERRVIPIEEIQRTVATFYKISPMDLRSNKRSREFSHPRQIAMYLCKKLTNHSYPEIGEQFGGRDHTTVLYAVGRVNEKQSEDSILAKQLQSLSEMLSH